ncbi:hypothetical protein HPB48_021089 [Haemaphysalis longicornis]|uniref:DDE Tnp4 domain-containing protein n=1 Tax=Haemaphysalis longicornis TaxID=44386 RepID=A0A9J6GZE2_HAELO|nr:hypothetical protein HPB48_021089 [Haemaphysalis longicornis]
MWRSPLRTLVLHNKSELAVTMLFGSQGGTKGTQPLATLRESEADADSDAAMDSECLEECSDSDSVPDMHNLELLCAVAEASRQKHDQVSHKGVCEVEVQCSPCVVSRHSGSDYRTSCFTGYDSVKSCASAVKDLCGVSMDVFALLLCLLTARAERSCDPPLCDKLLLFLMKLKLGISYSSLAVLFSAGLDEAEDGLVMPPFLHGQGQFTENEVQETYNIAQVRIHVERMIQRIKLYNILNSQVPTELLPAMSDVFHMCCVLANLQPPILKPNENGKQATCNTAPAVD